MKRRSVGSSGLQQTGRRQTSPPRFRKGRNQTSFSIWIRFKCLRGTAVEERVWRCAFLGPSRKESPSNRSESCMRDTFVSVAFVVHEYAAEVTDFFFSSGAYQKSGWFMKPRKRSALNAL
jgi:hypothetical protein